MPYNGLKSDMNLFSKFVFVYEKEIKHKGRADDFLQLSIQATYLFKHDLQPKIKYAKKNDIVEQLDFTRYSLFFTKDKVQILDFCRHLRNSFVHAILEKKGSFLYISDKSRNKETCKGHLEYRTVKKFINQIIKDYEMP